MLEEEKEKMKDGKREIKEEINSFIQKKFVIIHFLTFLLIL